MKRYLCCTEQKIKNRKEKKENKPLNGGERCVYDSEWTFKLNVAFKKRTFAVFFEIASR